jgi:hypothetical protein
MIISACNFTHSNTFGKVSTEIDYLIFSGQAIADCFIR